MDLFDAHLGWAAGIAKHLRSKMPRWVELDDVEQQARIGLWDAAPRFDPSRGTFKSFARPRVKGQVRDWQRVSEGQAWTRAMGRTMSVEPLVGYGERRGIAHERELTIPDRREPPPHARLDGADAFRALLRGLSARERQAVTLYYADAFTMREVGRLLHVSESRISQMLAGVLRRLRRREGSDGEGGRG